MPRESANSCYAVSIAEKVGLCREKQETHLGNGILDDLLVGHIALVADKELVDALGGVTVDLLQPLLNVVESVHIGHVVDDADAVSATVVRRSNGTEALLASGIPLKQAQQLANVGSDIVCSNLRSEA